MDLNTSDDIMLNQAPYLLENMDNTATQPYSGDPCGDRHDPEASVDMKQEPNTNKSAGMPETVKPFTASSATDSVLTPTCLRNIN